MVNKSFTTLSASVIMIGRLVCIYSYQRTVTVKTCVLISGHNELPAEAQPTMTVREERGARCRQAGKVASEGEIHRLIHRGTSNNIISLIFLSIRTVNNTYQLWLNVLGQATHLPRQLVPLSACNGRFNLEVIHRTKKSRHNFWQLLYNSYVQQFQNHLYLGTVMVYKNEKCGIQIIIFAKTCICKNRNNYIF